MSSSWSKVTNVVRASGRFQEVTDAESTLSRGPNPHILKKPANQPKTEAPPFGAAHNNNQQYGGGGPSTQYGSASPVQNQPRPLQWQQYNYNPAGSSTGQYNNQPGAGPAHPRYGSYQAQPQPNPGYQYQPYSSSGNNQNTTSTIGPSHAHGSVWSPNLSYGSGPQIEGQYAAQGQFRFERTATGYGTCGSDRAYPTNALTRSHTVAASPGYDAGNRDDIVNSAGATHARNDREASRSGSSSESVTSGYGGNTFGRGSEEYQRTGAQKFCYYCRCFFDEAGRCRCN